jgi:hypothetical protein
LQSAMLRMEQAAAECENEDEEEDEKTLSSAQQAA